MCAAPTSLGGSALPSYCEAAPSPPLRSLTTRTSSHTAAQVLSARSELEEVYRLQVPFPMKLIADKYRNGGEGQWGPVNERSPGGGGAQGNGEASSSKGATTVIDYSPR